jgi:TonB-linked SusC/RagA family outer membrane protein
MKQSSGINWLKRLARRLFSVVLVTFLTGISLYAQDRMISGTVKDDTGETLIGVNIVVEGTMTGTATDIDGNFTLKVPSNATISVNYVGYKKQIINVGNQSVFNIILEKDVKDLDEVVVVGYGVQKKKLVTGATTQVKSDDFQKNNVTRIESALQGLTPGMMIVKQSGQPGSDFNITIRGLSSINGNGPLVLVDGVPGSMSMVNPSDVESVDVLKDAASAAIYGSRAANGVVLITTKKGKSGEAQITYDAYYGVSNPSKKLDLVGAKEYAQLMNEASFNSKPKKALPFTQDYINGLGEGTDWIDALTNSNAPSQNHYLGISGGTDRSTYSISLSYATEEGIFDYQNRSAFQRVGFRINSEHKVKKYLKIGENLTYNHRKNKSLGTGNQYNNFLVSAIQASPLIPVYDSTVYDGFGKSKFVDSQENPIANIFYNYNGVRNTDDLIGDVYAELEIAPGLKFRSDFGGTLTYSYYSSYRDTFHLTPYTYNFPLADYEQQMSRTFSYNFDNVLSYEKDFGKNHLLALVGMNAQDGTYFNMRSVREGVLLNSAPVLTNVQPDTLVASYVIQGDFGEGDSRFSYFGRISYDFDEKYMATVSLRRDGSSRFGKNKRFGYFPSASAGWVITKEDFMKSAAWLNFLKVRASWGQNGKEPAEQYVYMARVGQGASLDENRSYSFGGVENTGISPVIFANPSLKWEASEQTNIGFDSRFLNDFRFTFDWYLKNSNDWIMQRTVPGLSGIAGISAVSNPFINGGNVRNTGVEFELGFQKTIKDFYVDVSANLSYNKNIVTDVPDSIIHGSTSVLFNGSDEFYRVQEGKPMGYFWGYDIAGIFQTQEEVDNYLNAEGKKYQASAKPGDVKRTDVNGDGFISDKDKVMLGDPNPDFLFGFRLSLNYKGIDLSMNVQGQAGNQIVQSYRIMERFYANYTRELADGRWQWNDANGNSVVDAGEGSSNTMPRVTLSDEGNQNWRKFSSLYIQDGDFVKLKSINLGYDLKRSLLKKTAIQKFRVYVSATNLFTLTKYTGMDPEIGYGSYYDSSGRLQDAYASGIDIGFYPTARTYLFGINVTF